MTPTNKLRFVEREEIIDEQHPTHTVTRTVRILQQFWAHPDGMDWSINKDNPVLSVNGTWRDVPVEKEHG